MKIALIILNWNGAVNTLSCLESLARIKKNGFTTDLIIIDNGSTDTSVAKIKSYFSQSRQKFLLIENKINLGFAGGNNVGIRYALGRSNDFLFILNNDVILEKNAIVELLKTQKKYKAGIVSPKIYFSPGREFHLERYQKTHLGKVIWYAGGMIDWQNVQGFHYGVDEVDQGQFAKETEIDYATGAALFVKKEVFKKVGLFDEKYYLYYEDLDFCLRVKNKGFKIIFSPKSILWHFNAGSSGSGSDLQDYYITRNRLIFGLKYAPFKSKLALVKEAFSLLLTGRKWQKKAVLDFIQKKFGRGSYE